MTPERWREIESLYHAALERPAGERAAFLEGCLRGRRRSCAAKSPRSSRWSRGRRRSWNGRPPPICSPAPFAGSSRRPCRAGSSGHAFGAYEVQALIAAGGMGEVYRAVDTRLNRIVALKTLPGHLSHDPERRARFTREARIVSSLNHPHICTLYDVGVQDERRLPGHGARRRRHAAGAPGAGTIAAGASARIRDPDRRRARQGAPAGHRAQGPEAGERHADGVRREAAGFRAGAGPRAGRRGLRRRRPRGTRG